MEAVVKFRLSLTVMPVRLPNLFVLSCKPTAGCVLTLVES